MNILIIVDVEGAVGIKTEKEVDDGRAVKAAIKNVECVIEGLKKSREVKKIYVWDFHGDEDNFKNGFGKNTKILSHPSFNALLKLRTSKVFLVGFHAMAGIKSDFCPHTYSTKEIKSFRINGRRAGEATLFALFFSEFNIPVVFISGSYYAAKELEDLGMKTEKVIVRKDNKVYDEKRMLEELTKRAYKALSVDATSSIIKYPAYKIEIELKYDCSSYFKDTCFKIVSNTFLVAKSSKFLVIFRDFVNSIHSVWGENRGF